MIANDFPPVGGAGVQRSLYFAKYLSEHGWRPRVLTVREVAFPAKDPTLLDELPPEVRVVRTESFELRRLLWLAGRLWPRRGAAGTARASSAAAAPRADAAPAEVPGSARDGGGTVGRRLRELGRALRRWLLVPDDRMLWAPFAVPAALRQIRRHPVRVIYATVPAYSSAVIGYRVSRRCGLPLVVDLRDPWTRDPYLPPPTRLHARINSRLEAAVLRHAARLVVISEEMRRGLRGAYPDLPEDKIRVITNGYDAAAFAAAEPVSHGERFVLSYVGSLYAHHRPALRAVCAAWSRAAEGDAAFADRAELEVIGRCDPEILDELAAWPRLAARVLGYVPHHRAAAHLKGASALLLLIKDLDPARDLITIPGKLFEYLGAGPPILMVGPEGDAAEIVRATGGRVLRQAELEAIAEALGALFHRRGSKDSRHDARADVRRRYDRRQLAAELAGVLEEAAATPR